MAKHRVIVTRRWPEAVEAEMREKFDVVLNDADEALDADGLSEALSDCDALCPTVTDRLDAGVIGTSRPRAKIIGNFGVGFNHIDLEAAQQREIVVTNTPEVLTDCTADLAMTLLLMTARRTGEGDRHVREKAWTGWRPTHMMGTSVTGKTLGLIGFGRIARATAARAHFGFGMRIIFHDPYPPAATVTNPLGATACDSPQTVCEQADFVSLHCPGGSATRHLMNAELLSCMKPHAFLINTARGDVVDQDALVAALNNGVIAGAGLDVYDGEPVVPDALRALDNVVLLPHLGSATTTTRVAMGRRVIANLEAFFAGREPPDRVA